MFKAKVKSFTIIYSFVKYFEHRKQDTSTFKNNFIFK